MIAHEISEVFTPPPSPTANVAGSVAGDGRRHEPAKTDVTTADARAGDSTVAGDSRFITSFNVGPRPTVSPKLVTAGDRFIS